MNDHLIVVGTSLGGTSALQTLLSGLPATFAAPVAIVQHRSKDSGSAFVNLLQTRSQLIVKEAEDKEEIYASTVYVAPADYHLLIDERTLALSIDSPVLHARPSIDVLFQSAADAYGARVIAVVLTGTNRDGMRGAKYVKDCGGQVVIQEPRECRASELPLATISIVGEEGVRPLEDIASFLRRQIDRGDPANDQ